MIAADPDVRATVTEFVKKNFLMGTTAVQFTDDDSFMDKGIVDSTGVLEMVGFLQRAFGITVQDEDLVPENLDSVNNIAAFVSRKRAGS